MNHAMNRVQNLKQKKKKGKIDVGDDEMMIDKRSRLKHLESLQFLSKRWLLLQIQTHPDKKNSLNSHPISSTTQKRKKNYRNTKKSTKTNLLQSKIPGTAKESRTEYNKKGEKKKAYKEGEEDERWVAEKEETDEGGRWVSTQTILYIIYTHKNN